MTIPVSPEWPILDFEEGLDITGWFDSSTMGVDWLALLGVWGVNFARDPTNTKILLTDTGAGVGVGAVVAPGVLGAGPWRMRNVVSTGSEPPASGNIGFLFGSPDTTLGGGTNLIWSAGNTWEIKRETAPGVFTTVAGPGLVLGNPGDPIEVLHEYVPGVGVELWVNDVSYGVLPVVLPGIFPHQPVVLMTMGIPHTFEVWEWRLQPAPTADMIPRQPLWPILGFAHGLDIADWFNPLTEGVAWSEASGGGWGTRYQRSATQREILIRDNAAPMTRLVPVIAPGAIGAGKWRTHVRFVPDITPSSNRMFIVVGGSPDALRGCFFIFDFRMATGLWDIWCEDGMGGALLLASGVDLTPTAGTALLVDLIYDDVTDTVECRVNGKDYTRPAHPSGAFVYDQSLIVIDPMGTDGLLTEWLVQAEPIPGTVPVGPVPWTVLNFTEGLDTSSWFDPETEGDLWHEFFGGGWGARYWREPVTGELVLNNLGTGQPVMILPTITPGAIGTNSWRVHFIYVPPTAPGNELGVYCDAASPDTGLGLPFSVSQDPATNLWRIRYWDAGGGVVTVASGLDLVPTPGDEIEVDALYDPTTGIVSLIVNGTPYALAAAHPPVGPWPHQMGLAVSGNTPGGIEQILREWRIGFTPPPPHDVTAFNRELGTQQGRLRPSGFTPPDGNWCFVLGADRDGMTGRFVDGDKASLQQTGPLNTGDVMNVRLRLRYSLNGAMLASWYWRLQVIVTSGGTDYVMAERSIQPAQQRDLVDVEFCWTLPSDPAAVLKIELQFVSSLPGPQDDIPLPSVYVDKVEIA